MARGLYRFHRERIFVQVQFGPFSRPILEEEYRAKGYRPLVDDLEWRHADEQRAFASPQDITSGCSTEQ